MSNDTEIFKKYPLVKAILDMVLKRLELIVVASVITFYQQHHVHNQIWEEVGSHLQDNVKQIQDLQVENDGFTHTNSLYNTNR